MNGNFLGTSRNIDMVFCIDGTGSMSPCIETIKENARRFHLEFVSAMTDKGSVIDSMRVKIIVFRDYKSDGQFSMEESSFFELPADQAEFESCMSGIAAFGGEDDPENGLEALYLAMKSDFTTGKKDRQIIILFTDADAIPLKDRASYSDYPSDMVDEAGFIEFWSKPGAAQDSSIKLRDNLKRLVMFAPSGTKYDELNKKLNRSVFLPVNDMNGLSEVDFKTIIDQIAASAAGV